MFKTNAFLKENFFFFDDGNVKNVNRLGEERLFDF